MDAADPRTRRRGMFFPAETQEIDEIETESAEGMPIRTSRRRTARAMRATSDAAYATPDARGTLDAEDLFRFASATDSRPLSPMNR